uniref:Ig-like domain-containing protein n=1 Tax=Chelydra serpentina TaxID=8475 RepID=A0A8C3XQX9_CHESE
MSGSLAQGQASGSAWSVLPTAAGAAPAAPTDHSSQPMGAVEPALGLTVKWYKEDEKGQSDLLENNVTVLTNYSRAFIHGNISQGDASLTILNVTASDHGIYFCQVTLSSGKVVMGSGTKLRIRRALGNILCSFQFFPLSIRLTSPPLGQTVYQTTGLFPIIYYLGYAHTSFGIPPPPPS